MTVQVYCDRDDVESIIGPFATTSAIDIDEDGVESTYESSLVTSAIQRAANRINAKIRHQYVLADVVGNDWLSYANAVLAAYEVRTMSVNPSEGSLIDKVNDILQTLNEIRYGRDQLPDQAPSFDYLPTVSSFKVQLGNPLSPITINVDQSTGSIPVGNRRRVTSGNWFDFWTY